ncbi:GMC family oxidoreductase N-terminal domain-containing protein [Halioxenophilus aromaticivorans]|uniref:Cholesterol oxidase n=1 Tax=Halioxenophilus aromaticivorans TaxID=1306992 RepID=A0AAV3U3G2_9ALTE
MKKMNRRGFVKSGLAAGAAASAFSTGLAKAQWLAPTLYTYRRSVVIGSGFGGSVAALRLGEAGIATALIERGKSWQYQGEDTFPLVAAAATEADGRTTWLGDMDGATGQYPVSKYTGMLERIQGDTVPSVVGAGLGGGSLVYGGVLLQPRRDIFNEVFPQLDYDMMDSVYYPRVLAMVSGGKIPRDILESPNYGAVRTFINNAAQAGFDITESDVGFNWNVIRREINGEISPFASIGEYVYGCNSNAKNTLDKNYIANARSTGNVSVHPLHNVQTIEQVSDRLFRTHCDVLNEFGELQYKQVFVSRYVFLAAGAINTTRLLLKSKALGDLSNLNDAVGEGFAGNGDELMGRLIYQPDISAIQGGPPCVAAHDLNNSIKPVGFMHSPSNGSQGLPDGVRMQLHMAMSTPNATGSIGYDANTDGAIIQYPYADNEIDRQAHYQSLSKMQHLDNGVIPGSAIGSSAGIWHPLGGTVMGQACGMNGQLNGLPNIFVVDGALMPGSTAAANPSLTIAANAERIMEQVIPRLS